MEVKNVLHMTSGEGERSYTQSTFTQKVNSITKPVLEKVIGSLVAEHFHQMEVLNIADLGCAAGPNTLSVISTVKETVEKKCRELKWPILPEVQAYLNDLPGNDFNSLFKGLSTFSDKSEGGGVSCFVMGVASSFHGRLFPRNTLHFVHSSYSAHWLSQVPKGLTSKEGLPLNKGKMYISKTSPPVVREAYLAQFQDDFTLFLKCRSEEMVANGRMVLILHGRESPDPSSKECCYSWELLAEAIAEMVSQGLIDQEKLDWFNVPYYTASPEEVEDIVTREGSFAIEKLETFGLEKGDEQEKNLWMKGKKLANNIRSFTESIISYHFGDQILDNLYRIFTRLVVEGWAKESVKTISIILVLSLKGTN